MLVDIALLFRIPICSEPQGFDAAAKAIFLCVGQDIFAAIQVFSKWAVPVAWLLMNEYTEGKRMIQRVSTVPYGTTCLFDVVGCGSSGR